MLSVFAFLLSLGMPGVGWALAAIVLIVTSLLTRFIGKAYIGAALSVTLIHLFTLGPLAQVLSSSRGQPLPPTGPLIIAVVLPIAIAIASLVIRRRLPENGYRK
jgi:hypothetical protein